jgi:hypothetical protein
VAGPAAGSGICPMTRPPPAAIIEKSSLVEII